MSRITIMLSSLLIIVLILLSGIIIYYQNIVVDKDSEISSLTSQITNQTVEIQNLTSQVENLTSQVEDLNKQVSDLSYPPTAVIQSIALEENYYYVGGVSVEIPIIIQVTNTGTSNIYNATLTAENIRSNLVLPGEYSAKATIPILRANQTLQTNPGNRFLCFSVGIDKMAELRSLDYLVTLSLNGVVIDQKTYYHASQ
jgi:cell division protein FtsL